jgi:hypothetical protein
MTTNDERLDRAELLSLVNYLMFLYRGIKTKSKMGLEHRRNVEFSYDKSGLAARKYPLLSHI